MTNITTIYIAIGLSFLINLIIIIAFRTADRKDRTLKSLNQQVKNFRSEVSSTMNRMSSTARDCEQNITSRIEHANTVQEHLAESIDLVLVHQKELDDLSGVCENYGNALKKLKVQTEQAENRLYAVQAEVRKIEAVNDYALQFQKEIERLTTQMGALKADYVRLVASTEQDLKSAAQNQKEENNEMLTLFTQSLDRAKLQFSDYIAQEKIAYDNICHEQELTAQNQLESLRSASSAIDDDIRKDRDELSEFISTIKAQLDSMEIRKDGILKEIEEKNTLLESDRNSTLELYENRKDNLFNELENKLKETVDELESAIKSTENILEEKLRDKEEDIESSLETYSERITEKEKTVEDALSRFKSESESGFEVFKAKLEELKASVDDDISSLKDEKDKTLEECMRALGEEKAKYEEYALSLRNARSELESELQSLIDEKSSLFREEENKLEEKRAQYIERCANGLDEKIESAQINAVQMLQKIKNQGDDFLKTVSRATSDSEKAYHILTESAGGRIREAEESLGDLRRKIKETEASLTEQVEAVTKVKEEIWNLQQEERSLENEISVLKEDKTKLQSEKAQAKSDRITEEANLVRLKGQQKTLQEEKEKREEKKKPIFEEMDIVTGLEEEVDVSDDDD